MSAKPLEIQECLVQNKLLMRREEALDFYQHKIGSILLNSSSVHPYKIHFTGYHKTPKWFVIMPCIRLGEFFTPQQAISLQVELRKNDHRENQNAYYIANYCDEQGEDRTKCYLLIHLWELKNLSDKVPSSSKEAIEKKCDAEASDLHFTKAILSQDSADLNKQKELKHSS